MASKIWNLSSPYSIHSPLTGILKNKGRKEGNVLFNDVLNTFYLQLYVVIYMVNDHSAREETHCRYIGYSFRLTARVLLYAQTG